MTGEIPTFLIKNPSRAPVVVFVVLVAVVYKTLPFINHLLYVGFYRFTAFYWSSTVTLYDMPAYTYPRLTINHSTTADRRRLSSLNRIFFFFSYKTIGPDFFFYRHTGITNRVDYFGDFLTRQSTIG